MTNIHQINSKHIKIYQKKFFVQNSEWLKKRIFTEHSLARGVMTLLPTTLSHKAPQLFKYLPPPLRNLTNCTTNKFKAQLDKFIKSVLDNPPVPG